MAVAVGSGLLGAFNSNRAEAEISAVANRDVSLLTPVRQMQDGLAQFQAVVDQASGGAATTPASLAAGITYSTSLAQSYQTLQHVLALPDNAGLAPRLDTLEQAFVASETGLVTYVAGATGTRVNPASVVAERQAAHNLDGALITLQSAVTARLVRSADRARALARDARNDLLWCLAIGFPFGLAVTALVARKAIRVERDDARRGAEQAVVTQRNEFEGRLQQALEMARSEAPALDIVAQALSEAAPHAEAEMLLADSSRAHFRRVLDAAPERSNAGCGVISPHECPAASSGQTKVFPDSSALGACPNLRGRGCSALCVPVSIAGNSAGVIHVTSADGSPPSEEVRRDVEVVARRASERFAMLRAFEVSQTQANTDSLTGLLTRRSLESSIGELEDSGIPYAIAYGDLDHFKQLNDVFGHSAGDRALRAFSHVLRDSLRPTDVACRYGGEEFVIVLPDCAADQAVPVLERVREQLAKRLSSGKVPEFTVSFGIASSDQAASFEQTVHLADEALLQAKAAGRDRIVTAGVAHHHDRDVDRSPVGLEGLLTG